MVSIEKRFFFSIIQLQPNCPLLFALSVLLFLSENYIRKMWNCIEKAAMFSNPFLYHVPITVTDNSHKMHAAFFGGFTHFPLFMYLHIYIYCFWIPMIISSKTISTKQTINITPNLKKSRQSMGKINILVIWHFHRRLFPISNVIMNMDFFFFEITKSDIGTIQCL